MSRTDDPALPSADLSGRRVFVPGGTGGVGEGVVRSYLAAGADVVVPTRTEERAEEFRRLLGDTTTERLHLLVLDYTTFAGAAAAADQVERTVGAVDDVVAPIGGWWGGARLTEIDEADWQRAFVDLATAHMAVLRAFLPRLTDRGAYSVIVGTSSATAVPGSGLVSMEQAAVRMMQQVAAAELGDRRVFLLVLGAMRTRAADGGPDAVTAEEVGEIAVLASAASHAPGQEVALSSRAELDRARAALGAPPVTTPAR